MGVGATQGRVLPTPARTLLWLLVYSAFLLLARVLLVPGTNISLVAPSSAVGVLWLASSRSRVELAIDSLLYALCSVAALVLTDAPPVMSALAALAPVLGLATLVLLRRWLPDVWGGGGDAPITTIRQFGMFLLAVGAGSLVYVVFRTAVGVALTSQETWALMPGRLARALSALVSLGLVGQMVIGTLVQRRVGTPVSGEAEPSPYVPTVTEGLHLVGAALASLAIFLFGFVARPTTPTAFLLTLAVVWVALTCRPLIAAISSLCLGIAGVWLTLAGLGPIAVVPNPEARSSIAQAFVVVLVVISTVVSLSRAEVLVTVRRLRISEARTRLRAAELDLVMTRLEDGIAIIEEGGRFAQSNVALTRLLSGPGAGESIDTTKMQPAETYQLHHLDGAILTEDELPYRRAIRGEMVATEDFVLRRPSVPGGRILRVGAELLPAEPEKPARAMVTVRDVTAESERTAALTAFAGTVAHDLNNPLSVLDGWAEALEEILETDNPDAMAAALPMLRHVRSSASQMRELVQDLLAHAQAQDRSLSCEWVSLDEVVAHIIKSRTRPDGKGGRVEAHGQLGSVWGDRPLLRQVLDNLVANAMKYVAPGVVPVVGVSGRAADGWVTVTVTDNGIGIPEEDREKVFEAFHRVATINPYAGTGLGLAICRQIVERHGGHIWADGNPLGGGSRICFTLPADETAYQQRAR